MDGDKTAATDVHDSQQAEDGKRHLSQLKMKYGFFCLGELGHYHSAERFSVTAF